MASQERSAMKIDRALMVQRKSSREIADVFVSSQSTIKCMEARTPLCLGFGTCAQRVVWTLEMSLMLSLLF